MAEEPWHLEEMLLDLRSRGWSVAVHNDYRLRGEAFTFWLFTHPNGKWAKGEGRSDQEALRQVMLSATDGYNASD